MEPKQTILTIEYYTPDHDSTNTIEIEDSDTANLLLYARLKKELTITMSEAPEPTKTYFNFIEVKDQDNTIYLIHKTDIYSIMIEVV